MARCLARGSDCTNGSPNLHRAIPARRTPSGPSGHLPRSAEKGGGAGVAESFRTLQLSCRMLPKRCNFLPKIAIPCPDSGLIKGLRASWRKKIMMTSFVAVQEASSTMGFPLSAQSLRASGGLSRRKAGRGSTGSIMRGVLVVRVRTKIEHNSAFGKFLLIGLGTRNKGRAVPPGSAAPLCPSAVSGGLFPPAAPAFLPTRLASLPELEFSLDPKQRPAFTLVAPDAES